MHLDTIFVIVLGLALIVGFALTQINKKQYRDLCASYGGVAIYADGKNYCVKRDFFQTDQDQKLIDLSNQ